MSIIIRICPICGSNFKAEESKVKLGRSKTCSRDCKNKLIGISNSKIAFNQCLRCNATFRTTPSKKSKGFAKYCSWECRFPALIKNCLHCGVSFRTSPSSNAVFCSKNCTYVSEERSQKAKSATINAWQDLEKKARILAGIAKRSLSDSWRSAVHFQKGENHPNYKGNRKARDNASRYEYKAWRSGVFKRDRYTCQHCGATRVTLNAHHIEHWADNIELRFDISNGISLCELCHDKVHGKIRKPKTYRCIVCGQQKPDGRHKRCKQCGMRRLTPGQLSLDINI